MTALREPSYGVFISSGWHSHGASANYGLALKTQECKRQKASIGCRT
jgi:hypothetical protein